MIYPSLYEELNAIGVARDNIDTPTDIICCPGIDYCALANADTINVTTLIDETLDEMMHKHSIGDIKIKISGCMNACGHHHVGHIGILGVEKKGEQFYQIQLGGSAEADATLGKVLGPAVAQEQLPASISRLVDTYLEVRSSESESFLQCVRRVGNPPFAQALYN